MLNLAPFVHLLVAAQLVREADRRSVRRGAAAIAAIAGIAVLASGAASIASTRSLIERTGGRGWWSDAIAGLASDLDADDIVVSLDWGFHLQLLFSTTQPRVIEPFWRIATDLEMVGAWSHLGSPSTLYLIHDRPYDRFGYGPRFLQAMDPRGATPPGGAPTATAKASRRSTASASPGPIGCSSTAAASASSSSPRGGCSRLGRAS